MSDLWPDDFGENKVTPPLSILREQAHALTLKTKGVLKGEVSTRRAAHGSGPAFLEMNPVEQVRALNNPEVALAFDHVFFVVVPSLDDYRFRLLTVEQPAAMYPLRLACELLSMRETCASPDKLEAGLREVFQSDKTKSLISGLLVQAKEIVQTS